MRERKTSGKNQLLLKFCCSVVCIFACLFLFIPPSVAQTAPPTPNTQGRLSPSEASYLLNTLNDPQKRETFTHNLTLLAKGLPLPTPPASPSTRDGEIFHYDLNQLDTDISYHFDNFTNLFKNLKYVGLWFKDTMQDPQARTILLTALADALFIVVIGVVAERGVSISLRPSLAAVTKRAEKRQKEEQHIQNQQTDAQTQANQTAGTHSSTDSQTDQKKSFEVLRYFVRIPYNGMHFIIKLCPVLAFWCLTALLADYFLPKGSIERYVSFLLINTYSLSRTVYLIIETTLAPHSPIIRLVPVKDDTALMLTRWWMLFVTTPATIVCMSVLGKEFHLVHRGIIALLRAVVLIQHLIVAAFIWRVRKLVAHALQPSVAKRKHIFGAFLGTLAHIWWIPVMFVDMALWFVWAAHLKNGYHHILLGTLATFVLIFIGRITALLVYGLENRFFTISPRLQERFPELQKRANFYYPYVHRTTSFIIILTMTVLIMESWGVPSLPFLFTSPFGKHLVGALLCFLVGLAIAAILWESVSELVNRRIHYYTRKGNYPRASRLKTILPILQTVLLTLIIVFVGVTTLAQLGINVTPLLTGAGILGVGLSFGSQSLVKDVITGFFMLAEDSIHVGDWVSTGSIAGTVEHLSIRTLRLRSTDGDLHIIPFSSVTSIANTGRDFNQIIINMDLDPDENARRQAVKIMSDTVDQMRQEPQWSDEIYSGYLDKGVDASNGGAATTVGIIRTAPMKKWEVKREFYRRVGPRMAEAGVAFYDSTNYMATLPKKPIRVEMHGPQSTVTPSSPQSASEGTPAEGKTASGASSASSDHNHPSSPSSDKSS